MTDYLDINEDQLGRIFTDEYGRQFQFVKGVRQIPRFTYVLGDFEGKYRGEIDGSSSNELNSQVIFNFELYEGIVNNCSTANTPFVLDNASLFPREKLPSQIPIKLKTAQHQEFEVNLLQPQLGDVNMVQKLHQREGVHVYGTLRAKITGYIVDFKPEEYYYKEYIVEEDASTVEADIPKPLKKTGVKTGKEEISGNSVKYEYYYDDYKTTYWGGWEYVKPPNGPDGPGCIQIILYALGLLVGLSFLAFLLPNIILLIPFVLIPMLLRLIPSTIWTWLFRIIASLFFILFLASIFVAVQRNQSNYEPPKPKIVTNTNEKNDSTINSTDSLITHYRIWQDYNGNEYEGQYSIPSSIYNNSRLYKNSLSSNNYNNVLYSLKQNDKDSMGSIYAMFDSISSQKTFNRNEFAELIVSFVQDIPYAVVLPDDCNPALYNDPFIKEYLNENNSICDGNQKYGINTPVEFLCNLKGDCDSRALLIYTILAHYDYDVAILSSDVYKHSIIGINLPYNGVKYRYLNHVYALWETTSTNNKPGVISNDISNMNFWSISIKSK